MSDTNYTLVTTWQDDSVLSEAILTLGGVVRRVVDLNTGEIAAESAEVSCGQDTAPGGAPLSKSHIRPQEREEAGKGQKKPYLAWCVGASFLKVSLGSTGEAPLGGGKRKVISGFSTDSRRRLMYAIASIRRDAELPCFVTLTYPNKFPDPKSSKRHLKMFCQRLARAFPELSAIWKLEPQDRGAPHYHLLVWGVSEQELRDFVPNAWHEIVGDGDENHLRFHLGLLGNQHCVNAVRSWRGVWSYASKYLGKSFDVAGWDDKHTGRFWGYVNKVKIPFGVACEFEVTASKAFHVMRYQRRFSKRRTSGKGFTLFCNSEQWIKNIFSEVSPSNK